MIKFEELLELAGKLYNGNDNVKFSDDESLELSDLFKKGRDTESEYEHYFHEFGDSGITEEQKEFIRTHDFTFEYYIFAKNIYLVIDEGKLDVSITCQSREFAEKFIEILQKKIKEKD